MMKLRNLTEREKLGYRDGVEEGKNSSVQEGFNEGYREAAIAGFNWGVARGITRSVLKPFPPLPFFHFFQNVHCPLSDSHVQSFATVFTAAAAFPFEHHNFLSGVRMLRV
jgi:hypothetical protein